MRKYIYEEKVSKNDISNPVEETISSTKQIGLFLIGWAGFQVLGTIISVIVGLIFSNSRGIEVSEALARNDASMIVNSSCYCILIITLLLLLYKDIGQYLQSFKKPVAYLAGFVCLSAILGFNIIYNIILTFIKTPVAGNVNQQGLESIDEVYPVASMIVFGIIGPICEEITYRVGLFSLFKRKSKVLAYIGTAVVFSLIHFNFVPSSLINELLNLPFYIFAAIAFSFTYDKFGLAGSLTAHIANNVCSLALVYFIH